MAIAEFSEYDKISVYVDDQLLTEETSLKLDLDTGHKEVATVQKGLCGFSRGVPKITIELENAVKAAGFEIDPTQFMQDIKGTPMLIKTANKIMVFLAQCTKVSISHSTEKATTYNFSFVATPSKFE
jgi:hypothetical protein